MADLTNVICKGKKRQDEECNDWGGYMRMKVRKLDEQFELIKNEDGILSNLFNGIVIFVNGYTVPSSDELKKLMKKHGGGFQQYYSRTKCTHIVATNLPDSKIKELRGEKVVHPNWILDSIKEGKLLHHRQYLLYGARGKYREAKGSKGALMDFVDVPGPSVSSEVNIHDVKAEDMLCDDQEDTSCSTTKNEQLIANVTTLLNSCSEVENPNTLVGQGTHSSTITDNFTKTAPENHSRSDKPHSSLPKAGDPNFVSEFYNHSRLHYLSTWGAEFKDFINNLITTTELKAPKRSPPKALSKKRVIMHVDMDSFFVSVTLRNRPDLKGKPVAVCHAGRGSGTSTASGPNKSFASTAEIASCSYEARSCGVVNGMWLGDARKLCPQIVCVPYEFKQYREVSQQLYTILASHTHDIQAVSCDEAFVDVTNCLEEGHMTPLQLAQVIRDEILRETKCPASAGIGPNILLARMCTKVAKPNGQFHIQPDGVEEFICKQKVTDLPGVGYSLSQKLEALNVETCYDLQRISMQVLRKEFGYKTGEMLYKFCRGQDDRQLKIERERKSVSADINYGIRFQEDSAPEKFICDLSHEVQRRMKSIGVKGKHLTFKLKVRQKDAPINPTKFMGCGRCDSYSRSVTMDTFTDDANRIAKECVAMLKYLGAPVADIRGMGIQMSKLTKDGRISSSMATKTIHDFMKPSGKTTSTNTTSTNTHVSENHLSNSKKTRGLHSDAFAFIADSSAVATRNNDRFKEKGDSATKSAETFTRNAEGFTNDSECVPRYGDSVTNDNRAITTSDDNINDFSLVLSEDEPEEEHALNMGQRTADHNENAPVSTTSQRFTNFRPITPNANNPKTKNDFPPLPVFPSFSPPPTSISSHSKNRSPRAANQNSPGQTNQRVHGLANQKSPKLANQRSPSRFTAKRNLDDRFQSPKVSDGVSALSLPSPSQIDPAVFEALPDEIKKDIEQSYQRRNQKFSLLRNDNTDSVAENRTDNSTVPNNTSQIDLDVFEALPDEIKKDIEQSYQQRNQKFSLRNENADSVVENRTDNSTVPNDTSQIDPDVFEALPDEIKNDIRYSYQQRNQDFSLRSNTTRHDKPSTSTDMSKPSRIDPDVFEVLPDAVKRDVVNDKQGNAGSRKRREGTEKKSLKQNRNKSLAKKRTIKSYTATKTVSDLQSLVLPSTVTLNQQINTAPDLDPSVMQAIPESLRHEVQMAYEQQRRHDEKNKQETNSTHVIVSVAKENTSAHDDNIVIATTAKQKISLAGAETLCDIRKMLKLWTSTTQVPLDEDIGILLDFLGNLIHEKDLEKMWIVLKSFRRLVCDLKSWHLSFNTVLHSIQDALQDNYAGRLALDGFKIETV